MYDLITQATATVDSATPDVSDVRNLVMPTNTARTEITSLTGKRKGEHLTLRVASGNDLIPFILPGVTLGYRNPSTQGITTLSPCTLMMGQCGTKQGDLEIWDYSKGKGSVLNG